MAMQILIGVDQAAGPVVSLLKRLAFPYAQQEVVHVVSGNDYLPYGVDSTRSVEDVERILDYENRHARQLVESLAREFAEAGISHSKGDVLFGHPADALLKRAEGLRAELIAVNAAHTHHESVAALTGSVARALLMGAHQSVLIARSSQLFSPDNQPVRAVFATDHSDYANRCLENLIDFAPKGLTHLTVVSAAPEAALEQVDKAFPRLGISVSASVRQALERRNRTVLQRLRQELPKVELESAVLPMPVHEALARAMDTASADLLILGAKGHSVVERLALGSVSLHQALSAPYSVLVLRA